LSNFDNGKNVSLFTSRFSIGLFLLEYIKRLQTLTLSPLAWGPPKVVEKRWLAAIIMSCILSLSVGLGFYQLCVRIVLSLTFVRQQ